MAAAAAAAAAATTQKVMRNAVRRLFALNEAPPVDHLASICSQRATREQYPLAAAVDHNVPIYTLLASFSAVPAAQRTALQDEWYRILHSGPGVFMTKGLFRDRAVLERANRAFYSITERERAEGVSQGDHFAAARRNDRIWNSFSKHALADPGSFTEYYANPFLGLISSAWLGGGYRVTAQVNNVRPGSKAQVCHRDYHLGFQTAEGAARVPRAMHVASQFLTLQGAVAHVDVPPESGPTRLLPFSQTFEEGYMAYRRQEFVDYFDEHHVALPMGVGDGIFFNPALFHAAGENVSADVNRMANLLQVSSPFGKPMESVDALPLLDACWDEIVARHARAMRSPRTLTTTLPGRAAWPPCPSSMSLSGDWRRDGARRSSCTSSRPIKPSHDHDEMIFEGRTRAHEIRQPIIDEIVQSKNSDPSQHDKSSKSAFPVSNPNL